MKFELFSRAVLNKNALLFGLKEGDMGIVVEQIIREGQEDGYIVEFFDAQGNTVNVLPVMETDLDVPRPNTILTYREMDRAA